MKKFIIQFIFLTIIIFIALAYATGKLPNFSSTGFIPKENKFKQVQLNDVKINIELADTSEKRKKGLSGSQSLASDSGMLFIFEKQDKYSFWMKGMKFPLDFIWIKDIKIVDIIKNAKVPDAGIKDQDLPIYVPNVPVDMVLEVTAGFVDSHKIKVGDMIELL